MAEGGGADWRLAALCLTLLACIMGALVVLASRAVSASDSAADTRAAAAPKKRGALDRMQRGATRAAAAGGATAAAAADGAEDASEDEGDEGDRNARRNAQKDQRKQEKRAQQQAERQVRNEREAVKSEKQNKYSQRQQDKEAERQRQEEQEKKEKEDREKKEQAEFDQWKEMFEVEAEGEDEAGGTGESAVERFIEYIKIRKVVNLEDLSAEFRMRTAAAIDRIRELEKLERLSGIFDDRGKYVYITKEELSAVADWINKKGRISRADLVAACNRIIRLNPTQEDKARLQQEAKTVAAALEEDVEEIADGAAQ